MESGAFDGELARQVIRARVIQILGRAETPGRVLRACFRNGRRPSCGFRRTGAPSACYGGGRSERVRFAFLAPSSPVRDVVRGGVFSWQTEPSSGSTTARVTASSVLMKARRTCSCTTATSSARASSRSPRAQGSRSSPVRARRAPRRPTWHRSRSQVLVGRGPDGRGRNLGERRAMGEPEEKIEFEGEVTEALRGRMFRIKLDNGHEAL